MSSRYSLRKMDRKRPRYDDSYIEESASDGDAAPARSATKPETRATSKKSGKTVDNSVQDQVARRPAGKTTFPLAGGKIGIWTPSSQSANDATASRMTTKPTSGNRTSKRKRKTKSAKVPARRRLGGKTTFPLAGGKTGTWTPPVDDGEETDTKCEDTIIVQLPLTSHPESGPGSNGSNLLEYYPQVPQHATNSPFQFAGNPTLPMPGGSVGYSQPTSALCKSNPAAGYRQVSCSPPLTPRPIAAATISQPKRRPATAAAGSRRCDKRPTKQRASRPTRPAQPTMSVPVAGPGGALAQLTAADAVLFGPNDPRRHQLSSGRVGGSYYGSSYGNGSNFGSGSTMPATASSAEHQFPSPDYSPSAGIVRGVALPDPFYNSALPSAPIVPSQLRPPCNPFSPGFPQDSTQNQAANQTENSSYSTLIPSFGTPGAPPAVTFINHPLLAESEIFPSFPEQPLSDFDLASIDPLLLNTMANFDQISLPIRSHPEAMGFKAEETDGVNHFTTNNNADVSTAVNWAIRSDDDDFATGAIGAGTTSVANDESNARDSAQSAPGQSDFVKGYETLTTTYLVWSRN